jgi:hypothetical protein
VLACFALLVLFIAVEALAGWRCDLATQIQPPVPQPKERQAAVAGIKDYSRPEDDAYLSLPEWYIVWSYKEKADFQQHSLPSGFPYLRAVRQYWGNYCCVSRLIRRRYAFNGGEQVMLVVIGSSFSAEYILKGIYENTLGRVSEWTSGHQFTEEDSYAYQVAREYADFVHVRPFYEFHFARHVAGLWKQNHLWGDHLLRKWERRAFLTADYSIEAFYCWVIEKGTHLSYGYEPDQTLAWVNADQSSLQQMPRLKIVKQVGPRDIIVSAPRYQEFTTVASSLSQRGVHFVEIAGNSSITFSVVAPGTWSAQGLPAQKLFSMPIVTRPVLQRIVFRCDVQALDQVLNAANASSIPVEHIYDF